MSKAQGKLITVKFTQPINELPLALPEYKYFRWEIDTKWSSYIYLYGIELLIDGSYILPTGIVSASGQYSSYEPGRAFDGSTSTYWRPNAYPCWIQIELIEPVTIEGFRWNTQTTSYRPRGFKLMASTNGVDWVELYNGESPAVSYWKSFAWEVYQQSGNERAFTVTGKEHQWVDGPNNNGPLLDKEYQIITVKNHPTLDNTHLQIIFDDYSRFPSVVGDITVEYDASLGNLAGSGGAVESFIETFTPTGLVPEPNPGHVHTLSVAPASLEVDLLAIEYIDRFAEETDTITVAPATLEVELIHIDIINP